MDTNVLLVVLDSVRARNTSLHGYERETTPFLDGFASESTIYSQARSPGMTSLPSHTSIFTGHHVEEHGAYDSIKHKVKPRQTVWDDLRDEGYTTGVFSYNLNLIDETSSLQNSFDYYDRGDGLYPEAASPAQFKIDMGIDDLSASDFTKFPRWALSQDSPAKTALNGVADFIDKRTDISSMRLERALDQSGDRYISPFLDWIDSQSGPWGACLNLMDAHHPYYPRPEHDLWGGKDLQKQQAELDPHPWKVHGGHISWDEWCALEDLYDGTIRQTDAFVEQLINELRQRGAMEDTLVVITSDHGEGFGEESRVRPGVRTAGHVAGLHESLLHVPLVVSYPGQTEGKTIDELATLTQFPEVVTAARDESWEGDEFVPDGPVLASGSNIDNKLKNKDRAGKFVDDTGRFQGIVRAVFERDDDSILKHMTWGDDEATVRINSVRDAERVDLETFDSVAKVEEAFGPLEDAEILEQREDDVGEATKQRLADLGYV